MVIYYTFLENINHHDTFINTDSDVQELLFTNSIKYHGDELLQPQKYLKIQVCWNRITLHNGSEQCKQQEYTNKGGNVSNCYRWIGDKIYYSACFNYNNKQSLTYNLGYQ